MTADSIRGTLPPGDVTVGDVHAALPYDNRALVYQLRVAGVRYVQAGARAVQVRVAERDTWRPLDPDRTYEVAINAFTARMVPAYRDVLRGQEPRDPGLRVRDVVVEGLRGIGHLDAGLDGRVGDLTSTGDAALDHPA